MSEPKLFCKTIQLIHGVDLLGSRMSLSAKRGHELEITPYGVAAHGQKSKRTVLIPWNNIRGVEMYTLEFDKKLENDQAEVAVQAKPRGRPKAQV